MGQSARRTVADKIKQFRKKKGITKENLSLLLDCDNSYISKLEKYKVNFTIDRLEDIAKHLDVKLKDFFN